MATRINRASMITNKNMINSGRGAISNMVPLFAVTWNAARKEAFVCSAENNKIPIAASANREIIPDAASPILRRMTI